MLVPTAPFDQGPDLFGLGGDQRVGALAAAERVELRLVLPALFLVRLLAAQDFLVVLVLIVQTRVGGRVVAACSYSSKGPGERPWAGQEPLLQQHRDDVAGPLPVPLARALAARMRSRSAKASCSASARVERDRLDLAGLEILVLQFGLQPADHHLPQRGLVDAGAAAEPAPVDHLQQGGERLRVAVVRRRAQEQPVLALLGQRPGGQGALTVHRVTAAPSRTVVGPGRRHMMGLVNHEGIEREPPGGAGVADLGVARRAAAVGRGASAARPCCTMTRGNSRNGFAFRPWLRRTCAISSLFTITKSRPNFSRISSCHFSDRLGGHTIITVRARCRSSSSWMTRPGLDGLAQPHVVGEQQVGSRRLQTPDAAAPAGRPPRSRRCGKVPGRSWRPQR